MRRLVGDGITHAIHDGTVDTAILQVTACGIQFVGYDLPNEDAQSSLGYMFRTINLPGGIVLLRGTFENRPVDCMSCLVEMRTWNQT